MIYDEWLMIHGSWFMAYGYGLWFMVYGLWFTVYGLWLIFLESEVRVQDLGLRVWVLWPVVHDGVSGDFRVWGIRAAGRVRG